MFKVGDKVQRKASRIDDEHWVNKCKKIGVNPDRVFTVTAIRGKNIELEGIPGGYDTLAFEVYKDSILVGGIYKTIKGDSVRIICTDRKSHGYPVCGLRLCDDGFECFEQYTAEGKSAVERSQDLVLPWNRPDIDWSKVSKDTLINVDGRLVYFSRYEYGQVYYFNDGTTSETYKFSVYTDPTRCNLVKD